MYDRDDLRLAQEMLRFAYESGDGEEIYGARRYLREVKQNLDTDPADDDF